MTVLLGPADADHFRVKVGRYGDRWYHDPLPADDIAPACDTVWPSISTAKKASGSDWSFVSLKRAAIAIVDNPARIAGLPVGEMYDALKSMNQRGLEAAAQRGTNVHLYAESLLRGTPCLVGDGAPGTNYFAAVDAFFDQYQPELVAAEYVTIHRTLNGVGYGGTPDAIVRIDGKLYAIDWKSRGEDSDHGGYPEEAAQIAAGARADYMIIEGVTGPERRAIPALDGGLIVSIKPDGCRVYPVDLDRAWAHWTSLHAWWVSRRDERESIRKPWTPKKVAAGGPASPPAALSPAEQKAQLATDPDEGGDGDVAAFAVLERDYKALSEGERFWIGRLAGEAQRHGVSFHAKDSKTVRRFELLRGLVALTRGCHDDEWEASDLSCPDDDTLRAVLASVVGDVAWFPSVEPGHVVGSLSAGEAAIFARRADELVSTTVPCAISPEGRLTLEFTDLAATAA